MRACEYSPNNIGNDAAIFNAVADGLHKHGFEVNVFSEERFIKSDIEEKIILNMCREQRSIQKLITLEDDGRLVINSGKGIKNCTRERMTHILIDHNIPYPDSLIVNTNEDIQSQLENAGFETCWIKRGDFHAVHKEDVSYCRNAKESRKILHDYYCRGIERAVINRHLPGDVVKFYGVSGQPFFHWFYPFDAGHSKYGHEAVNGISRGYDFNPEVLKEICQKAADIMGIKIFGGDCIVDADGTVRIIDFNDWPSFAPCREEASVAITNCVLQAIQKWENNERG